MELSELKWPLSIITTYGCVYAMQPLHYKQSLGPLKAKSSLTLSWHWNSLGVWDNSAPPRLLWEPHENLWGAHRPLWPFVSLLSSEHRQHDSDIQNQTYQATSFEREHEGQRMAPQTTLSTSWTNTWSSHLWHILFAVSPGVCPSPSSKVHSQSYWVCRQPLPRETASWGQGLACTVPPTWKQAEREERRHRLGTALA